MSWHPGERIAQLAVLPVCLPDIAVVDALEETERAPGDSVPPGGCKPAPSGSAQLSVLTRGVPPR